MDGHMSRLRERVTASWWSASLTGSIYSGLSFTSRFALPGSESIVGISHDPHMCAHTSYSRWITGKRLMGRFLSFPFLTSKDLYSPEGLLDFENEKYLVSIFHLCRAQLLLLFILEYLFTGDILQLFRLGPIYLLPQRYLILRDECNSIMIKKNRKVICIWVISSFIGRYKFSRITYSG